MYLPLIGQNALTGYLWLLNEGQFLKTEQDLETSLTRLSKHLELPLGRVFSEVLNILEGVSLVKTYLEGEEGYYICKVMSPLSVEKFINTTHLSVLAKNIIGKSNWERTLAFFLKEEIPPSSAINISKKFDSFYEKAIKIISTKQGGVSRVSELLKSIETKTLKMTTDFENQFSKEEKKGAIPFIEEIKVKTEWITSEEYFDFIDGYVSLYPGVDITTSSKLSSANKKSKTKNFIN